MGKKVALVALTGEPMCFVHVLLNAVDMKGRGYDVRIVIEGEATKLIPRFLDRNEPFKNLFSEVLKGGMVECACKACTTKMGAVQSAKDLNIELKGEMSGHPSMARLMDEGFDIVTF